MAGHRVPGAAQQHRRDGLAPPADPRCAAAPLHQHPPGAWLTPMTSETGAQLDTPFEGLLATPPSRLPYQHNVLLRSYLLERPAGNIVIYNSPGVSEAADSIRMLGAPVRLLVNHSHEAMYGRPSLSWMPGSAVIISTASHWSVDSISMSWSPGAPSREARPAHGSRSLRRCTTVSTRSSAGCRPAEAASFSLPAAAAAPVRQSRPDPRWSTARCRHRRRQSGASSCAGFCPIWSWAAPPPPAHP